MRAVLSLAGAVLLAGCMRVTLLGHTVTEGRAPAAEKPLADEAAAAAALSGAVNAITVSIIPEVAPQVLAGARIEALALRAAMETIWGERRLLDAQVARHSADVQVIDAVLQRTGNAVMFGQIPASGRLTGLVRIRDAGGQELRSFRVVAESPLSIPQEGGSTNALARLYRQFAEQAAVELASPSRQAR